jgi:ankyrin repeat protein
LERSFHERFNWRAEDFFDDAQVIALCHAIEGNDLAEIDRLVKAGADVNALGKGNMTPLMWAFPDNKPERFRKLLELGADPNVVIESDFNTRMSGFLPGDSVTLCACRTAFPHYFDAVFDHGGDPNWRHRRSHVVPLIAVIEGPAPDKLTKVRRLIKLGANLDANIDDKWTDGKTAVVAAVRAVKYDIALELLKAGATYKVRRPDSGGTFVNLVAGTTRTASQLKPEARKALKELVDWLVEHGEAIEGTH